MDDLVQREYEQARYVLRNLKGLIDRSVPWPQQDVDQGVTGLFGAVIEDLYRDRAALLEVLRRKDEFLSLQWAAQGEWAKLEELV